MVGKDVQEGKISGGALEARRAQALRDLLDRAAPIYRARAGLKTEGADGIGGRASVAEDTGTGLTCEACCLVPLGGIARDGRLLDHAGIGDDLEADNAGHGAISDESLSVFIFRALAE